jgi:hypothetical protein
MIVLAFHGCFILRGSGLICMTDMASF